MGKGRGGQRWFKWFKLDVVASFFFPPGIPSLTIKDGLFEFEQRQGAFLAPAHTSLLEAGSNGGIDIGFDGSGSGDAFIFEPHLISNPLAVMRKIVVEFFQEIFFL